MMNDHEHVCVKKAVKKLTRYPINPTIPDAMKFADFTPSKCATKSLVGRVRPSIIEEGAIEGTVGTSNGVY